MTKSCISFLLHRTGTVAGPLVSSECSQGGWRGTMEMGETQITVHSAQEQPGPRLFLKQRSPVL